VNTASLELIDTAAREAAAIKADADAWAEECCRLVVEAERYPNGVDKRLFAAAASLRDIATLEAEAATRRLTGLILAYITKQLDRFGYGVGEEYHLLTPEELNSVAA
jgi:hypothetical protein